MRFNPEKDGGAHLNRDMDKSARRLEVRKCTKQAAVADRKTLMWCDAMSNGRNARIVRGMRDATDEGQFDVYYMWCMGRILWDRYVWDAAVILSEKVGGPLTPRHRKITSNSTWRQEVR